MENLVEVIKVESYFPRLIGDEENDMMLKEIYKEEFWVVLSYFQIDKIPHLNGWKIEFYLYFFEILWNDILKAVEELTISRRFSGNFNSKYITIIIKVDCPNTFKGFGSISLCNNIYKIISKVISISLKPLLSCFISLE